MVTIILHIKEFKIRLGMVFQVVYYLWVENQTTYSFDLINDNDWGACILGSLINDNDWGACILGLVVVIQNS